MIKLYECHYSETVIYTKVHKHQNLYPDKYLNNALPKSQDKYNDLIFIHY